MDHSSHELLRELAEWQPAGGVISVYLHVDPADRNRGWRIELEHGLKRIVDGAENGADRRAVAGAAERIFSRLPEESPQRPGRVRVGFVQAAEDGREVWRSYQAGLKDSLVLRDRRPRLLPLVRLLERGAPVGVVLLAAEQARVLEWAHGRLDELGTWNLEPTSGDPRERRSPRRDPQRDGTGTTSSGRDQHQQRIESTRARFLKQLGGVLGSRFGERDWRRILVFGEGGLASLLGAGLGPRTGLVREVQADLIRAENAAIEAHVEAEVAAINLDREHDLLERIDEAIGRGAGAAAGPQEVLGALDQGRASHLVFDAGRRFETPDGHSGAEAMIDLGLATGAAITPVEHDESTARLAEREGAAALLRY